jgi:hypothetical protein
MTVVIVRKLEIEVINLYFVASNFNILAPLVIRNLRAHALRKNISVCALPLLDWKKATWN